jgi:hypothetical protein
MEAELRIALSLVAKSAESLALANFVRPQADVADILGDILRAVDVLASAKTPLVFLCGHAAFAAPLVVTLPHFLFNRTRICHYQTPFANAVMFAVIMAHGKPFADSA